MTLAHWVSLWKPRGSGLDPPPRHATGRLKEEKKPKERVEVRKWWSEWEPKEGEEEVKGRWRWRGWAKTSVGGGRGGGRASSLAIPKAGWDPEHSAQCEDRQSSVLQPSLRFNLSGKGLPPTPSPALPTHTKFALSSSPLPQNTSSHPSARVFDRRTAPLTLNNPFKGAETASVKYTPVSASV